MKTLSRRALFVKIGLSLLAAATVGAVVGAATAGASGGTGSNGQQSAGGGANQ